MSKKTKKVMLTLDENLFYFLKARADEFHMPIATYIKFCLVKMKEDNYEGK